MCIFSKSTKTKVLLLFDDYEIIILNVDDIKKCILLTLYKDKESITTIELDKKTRRKPLPKTDLRKQDLVSLINLDRVTSIRVHRDDYGLLHNETVRKDVYK